MSASSFLAVALVPSVLSSEYERVLAGGLLSPSMDSFRVKFRPISFTEERLPPSPLQADFMGKIASL